MIVAAACKAIEVGKIFPDVCFWVVVLASGTAIPCLTEEDAIKVMAQNPGAQQFEIEPI